MHNPTAGSGDHFVEDLIAAIVRAGHEVVAEVCSDVDLAAATKQPCHLVAVAGGDGTVGHAAEVMTGTGIPMAVIPLGTANNIARTLGFPKDGRTAEQQVAAWSDSTVHDLDGATVTTSAGRARFLECLGFGVFAETIAASKQLPERSDPRDTLRQHLTLFRALIATGTPRRYRVTLDDVDASGEYLLVEVMNVPYLGPRLVLAPAADPHDGKLDVVLVRASDRDELLRHVDAIAADRDSMMSLPIRRAARVSIAAADESFHRDGRLEKNQPCVSSGTIDVYVEPKALQVLRRPRP